MARRAVEDDIISLLLIVVDVSVCRYGLFPVVWLSIYGVVCSLCFSTASKLIV